MASLKLRVRAAAGGQTIRVQVPLLCTLEHLKSVLSPMILCPASAIRLSLNKRDELEGPGGALLSSFGLTSGDLLFYIVNDSGRSPFPNSGPRAAPDADRERRESQTAVSGLARDRSPSSRSSDATENSSDREAMGGLEGREAAGQFPRRAEGAAFNNLTIRRELCAAAADRRATNLSTGQGRQDPDPIVLDSPLTEAPEGSAAPPFKKSAKRGADVDLESDEMTAARDGGGAPEHRQAVPIPYLLHRVLACEVGNVSHPSSYLVLAVHAMMLETGFVRVEAGSSGAASVGYGLPAGWSASGVVTLTYSLPELVRAAEASPARGRAVGEEALLRCRIVGNAVVVYGAVTGGSVHRVSLSVSKFLQENVPLGRSSIAGGSSRGGREESGVADGSPALDPRGDASPSCSAAEDWENDIYRDILWLWKDGKDSLSLPLLSFMCESAGLDPPPSLLRLPTELKLKVLESLPSVALASVSCTCSELRFLAAGEEMWKQRYVREFGTSSDTPPGGRGWKNAFARDFKRRKRWEAEERAAARRLNALVPPVPFFQPFPPQFGVPDLFRGLAGPLPVGDMGPFWLPTRPVPGRLAAFPSGDLVVPHLFGGDDNDDGRSRRLDFDGRMQSRAPLHLLDFRAMHRSRDPSDGGSGSR